MARSGTTSKTATRKNSSSGPSKTTNYRRGARFERLVRDRLYEVYGAAYVVRSAGSKGVADLVALFSWGEVWLVQCKTDGKLPDNEKVALLETAANCRAQPRLAHKKDGAHGMENLDNEMRAWKLETGWNA